MNFSVSYLRQSFIRNSLLLKSLRYVNQKLLRQLCNTTGYVNKLTVFDFENGVRTSSVQPKLYYIKNQFWQVHIIFCGIYSKCDRALFQFSSGMAVE